MPIIVRAAPRARSRAILQFGPLRLQAAIGRSGITAIKREGDGATPRATMKLISGYMRGDRIRGIATALPMRRLKKAMLWCDAPTHPAYNRPVRAPFAASHEDLMRDDHLYDVCLVMDWNISSRRRGCGSAIFFHLARPGYKSTEGCIAVSLRDMKKIAAFMTKDTRITVL
ncbi:MAG: L,D-transpeptidase family protein [Allorhizobium sp.]